MHVVAIAAVNWRAAYIVSFFFWINLQGESSGRPIAWIPLSTLVVPILTLQLAAQGKFTQESPIQMS